MTKNTVVVRVLAMALVVAVASGCAAVRYVPQASLSPSPSTIPARVEVGPFAVGSQESDSDVVPLDTAANIRDAVASDFANSRVFTEVGTDVARPDLRLTGEVRKFYGRYGTTTAGWLSVLTLWVLAYWGIPINYSEGAVDLQVTLARPDGTVLGQYVGRSAFDRTYTMSDDLSGGLTKVTQAALNQALTESLDQIRTQILADSARLAPR